MKHQVFISYPIPNEDIVKNLASRLKEFGVAAWVYSIDKTLAKDLWTEIEAKIQESEVFIFVASKFSKDAQGQHRELSLALTKFGTLRVTFARFQWSLTMSAFEASLTSSVPRMEYTCSMPITSSLRPFTSQKRFPPRLWQLRTSRGWNYPRPGQWLDVCQIDRWIEEYFDLGDRVYFRRLSPLGLFGCYSPKLGDLFWFAPHNLRMSDVVDEDGSLEREKVPRRYRYYTSIQCERIGLQQLEKEGRLT